MTPDAAHNIITGSLRPWHGMHVRAVESSLLAHLDALTDETHTAAAMRDALLDMRLTIARVAAALEINLEDAYAQCVAPTR